MTKLITVRVQVAVDDDVTTAQVKPKMKTIISNAGIEGGNDEGGRIFWMTAEVLQGPEAATGKRERARPRVVSGQGDLAT